MTKSHIYIILITTFFLFSFINLKAQQELKFYRYSDKQGLGDSWINCTRQDKFSYIWTATGYGLYKFDAYSYKTYLNNPMDSNSLADNFVKCIFLDSKKQLWFGHRKGLSLYNYEKDNFTNIKFDFYVNHIWEDKNGSFWLSTSNGLVNYNHINQIFKIYNHDNSNKFSISYSNVNISYQDNNGTFWVATDNGLDTFNLQDEKFYDIPFFTTNINFVYQDSEKQIWIGGSSGLYKKQDNYYQTVINDISVLSFCEDFNKNLWFGTYTNGLYRLKPNESEFSIFISDNTQTSSLPNNKVSDLFISNDSTFWISTYGGGVCTFDFKTLNFKYYRTITKNDNSLNSNDIYSFYLDKSENLWIATFDGGLNKYDIKNNKFSNYQEYINDKTSQSLNNLFAVSGDLSEKIYLATRGCGLSIFDSERNKFVSYANNPQDTSSISGSDATCLYFDIYGNIWVGTLFGLNLFDKKTEKFTRFLNNQNNHNTISDNNIWCIYQDNKKNLWVGTKNGLNLYDYKNKTFSNFKNIEGDTTTLINNHVWCIYQDSENTLWIGTLGGISKFNYQNLTFKSYTEAEGLSNNVVFGIMEDNSGNLWLTTNKYLNKFNPKTETFVWFDENDGLQSNEFNPGAYFKDKTGRMYIGGTNGFNIFYPDSIKQNNFNPKVVITNFLLFNKSISVNDSSVLKKSLDVIDKIELTYDDYIFAFEFSALGFSQPEKYKYAYMLEGFNTDWFYTDYKDRKAVYTNVPPGTYTFRVKVATSSGIWSQYDKSIEIIISPPWWKTLFAKIIWITLFIGLLVSFYYARISRMKKRQKQLEQKVEERTMLISQQKEEIQQQAEELETINKQLEKLSIAASETSNAIMIMDAQGNFEWVNEGFTKLYGYTFSEYTQLHINLYDSIISKNTREIIREKMSEKESYIYETIMVAKSGEEIWIQTTTTPVVGSLGFVEKIIAIDSDIRQLKRVENELNFKNKLITDSINYAKTIQSAILPLKEQIDEIFNSFIIFRPKDIVSGDFYWYYKDENIIYLAVVDCTGHGVPGAFMSLIGNTILSEIMNTNKNIETHEILELLDIMIKTSLQQDKTENSDGMDVALVKIQNDKNFSIQFSGAKRPLVIYRYEENSIETIKGNRRSIGGVDSEYQRYINFESCHLELKEKDRIFMFSDGITDLNNNNRKRFGTKHLTDIIFKSSKNIISEQCKIIEKELDEWITNEVQRDDIALVGIEFR